MRYGEQKKSSLAPCSVRGEQMADEKRTGLSFDIAQGDSISCWLKAYSHKSLEGRGKGLNRCWERKTTFNGDSAKRSIASTYINKESILEREEKLAKKRKNKSERRNHLFSSSAHQGVKNTSGSTKQDQWTKQKAKYSMKSAKKSYLHFFPFANRDLV